MRIEWVMWIDRGSCDDSLRWMTQGFCFTVFCISPPGISKGLPSKSRQANIETFLISHVPGNRAPVAVLLCSSALLPSPPAAAAFESAELP